MRDPRLNGIPVIPIRKHIYIMKNAIFQILSTNFAILLYGNRIEKELLHFEIKGQSCLDLGFLYSILA